MISFQGGHIMHNISIREPGSAITHFIAMILAMGSAIPLLIKAAEFGTLFVIAMFVFIGSMVLLYGASATYHSINVAPNIIKIFRKIDHMMIFIMIAGSYTPVCLLVLDKYTGSRMLAAVWGVALLGILIKALWITCPKWFSSILYIGMGWICISAIKPIIHTLSLSAFMWLLAGGLLYTVGGVIYALKLKVFNEKHAGFGSHEIFHLFIMAGSFCHFIFMYQYVI